jgi:hypothetical protein
LDEIIATKNKTGLPLAEYWALSSDTTVTIKAIEALRILEAEEAVPRLLELLKSNNVEISCAAAKAFEYFYWKDEAVIERKKWAVSELIKTLSNSSSSPEKTICALKALAESETFRALEPLLSALESPNNKIAAHAARALGMLRQTEATTALTQQLNSSPSPIVRAEAFIALIRLKADISAIPPDKIVKTGEVYFNALFYTYLKKSTDGVNAGFIDTELFHTTKSAPHYFNYLSADEIFDLYELLDTYKQDVNVLKNITEALAAADKSTGGSNFNPAISDIRLGALANSISTRSQGNVKTKENSVICNTKKIDLPSSTSNKNTPDAFNTPTIADNLRLCINSGFYTESKILAHAYSQLDTYWIALIQLINNPNVQNQEVIFIARNYPLPPKALAGISLRVQQLPTEEQLELLRTIEQRISPEEFKHWLDTWKNSENTAIKYFISGRL